MAMLVFYFILKLIHTYILTKIIKINVLCTELLLSSFRLGQIINVVVFIQKRAFTHEYVCQVNKANICKAIHVLSAMHHSFLSAT